MLELETLKKTLLQGRYFLNCVYKMHLFVRMKDVLFIQKSWLNKKPEHHLTALCPCLANRYCTVFRQLVIHHHHRHRCRQ